MKKITLLILINSMVFGDLPSSDIHPAESSTIIDTKPENHTNTSPSKKSKKIKNVYQAQKSGSGYGWVQDIVGIDEDVFNYVEGSDEDLELYLRSSFFSNVALSPDGKHLAFQSKSDEFTEGLVVARTDDFLDPKKGLEKATVAKAALENRGDDVFGIKELFLCSFDWVSNSLILVEVCGKQFDRLQGEIFQQIGIFKLFNIKTREFKNFIYPLEPAPKKGSMTFADRYRPATFISKYDDESLLMSVAENKRGFRYAHLRQVFFNKNGSKPTGKDLYVSKEPCQFKVGYKANSACNIPYIYILDKDKKPALTFSSDLDGVYAHLADDKTTKIDIDIEDYTPFAVKGDLLWMYGVSGIGAHGISVLNLKTKKIQKAVPSDCHSVITAMNSLNEGIPYAVDMECDGKKEIIYFDQDKRDAQILSQLSQSFPDKNISLGNWTDKNDKAIFSVSDSSVVSEFFMLDLTKGSLIPIGRTSNVPKEKLHKMVSKKFKTRDDETIYGFLTMPKGEVKRLIVYIHGGPYGIRDFDQYDFSEQYLASKGAAILKVNYRGSGGYGKDFMEDAYKEWGGTLLNDIADATIAVQKELGIGRSKTCAFGASYGGYAALGMAYKHSDLYECVAGGMGVYDMKILRDGSDDSIYTRQDSYEETAEKFWGDDEDQLVDFSPVFNADKMNSRILMWHGLQDPISPIVHLDLMKEALEENNVPYQAFTMSKLGHTFGKKEDIKAHLPVLKNFLFDEL
jgi:acetyl esterase/lipase